MTPEAARLAKGWSLTTLAKRLRPGRPYHPRYLRRLELYGCPNYALAERWATLLDFPMEWLMRRPQGQRIS